MFSRRFVLAVLLGGVVLLAACTAGLPAPLLQPTLPVSPLPTPMADGNPQSTATESVSPQPGPTAGAGALLMTPAADMAAITGRLIDVKTSRPMGNVPVSLPSVICPPGVADQDKHEQCVSAIDEAFDPSVMTNANGEFVFRDIQAGDYVMLVGNPGTTYIILSDEANRALIWSAKPNQVLNLGDLVVEVKSP